MRRLALFILIFSIIYIFSCIEPNLEGSIGDPASLSIPEKAALYEVLNHAFSPVMGRLQEDHLLLLAEKEVGTRSGSRFKLALDGAEGQLLLSGVSGYHPYSLKIDTLFNNFVLAGGSFPLHIEGMGKVTVTSIPDSRSYRIVYRGAVDIIEGNSIRLSVPWEITVEADLTDVMAPVISESIKIYDLPFYPAK